MKTLPLLSGRTIPTLGQGTWAMGENRARRNDEVAALRLGLDLGLTLIDTAEMYGDGGAEEVVGEAIAGRRPEVFLVSKVLPQNASRQGTVRACERSLRRLKTDYLDLYLLHWRESVPIGETLDAFQSLKREGKIRDFGVSNFDRSDMEEALGLPGGGQIVTNQVLYSLLHRGIEADLLPWCREHDIPIMAYSPLESSAEDQAALLGNPRLKTIAGRHGGSPAQVAIAWLLHQEVVVIPKAVAPKHVRENRAALDLHLTSQDLEELDEAFPPIHKKVSLEMK